MRTAELIHEAALTPPLRVTGLFRRFGLHAVSLAAPHERPALERSLRVFHTPDDPSAAPLDPDRFGDYEIVLRRRVTPNRFLSA